MAFTLVYEHDQNGNTNFGDINTLITAIKNGSEVRVVRIDDATGDVRAAFTAQTINVRAGVVYAQNTNELAQNIMPPTMFQDSPAYHFYYMISTSGDMDIMRFEVGTTTIVGSGHSQIKTSAKWFIS